MAISNERIRLSEFMASGESEAVAKFIANTPKIQEALLEFNSDFDIDLLVNGLRRGKKKAREYLDDYLEVKTGKLPVGKLPHSVRVEAARDERIQNARLAKESFTAAVSALSKGRLLSSAFNMTKFMTEASASVLSAFNLTVRERRLAMALSTTVAAVGTFGDTTNAAINPAEIDSAINSAKQTRLEERMAVLPRSPVEITITPRKDFDEAKKVEANYLLSPYLIKKLETDPKAGQYMKWILREAKRCDLQPVLFANQIFRESNHFNPAYIYGPDKSSADAMGIAQITYKKGKEYGLTDVADYFDPQKSLATAADIMCDLKKDYNNDQVLAMAAYNGGKGAVDFVIDELNRTNITGQDWMAFMAKRFEELGNTKNSAWHMETRLYIADITNLNWENTYTSWAKKLQGPNPMQYVAQLSQAKKSAQQAIENAIN